MCSTLRAIASNPLQRRADVIQDPPFHFVTVGWNRNLIERLWHPVAATRMARVSHILHPRYAPADSDCSAGIHCVRSDGHQCMPAPDMALLASLEQAGVPTIHNMFLGDRVVSKLAHHDAMAYATFLARRLMWLFEELKPSVIIGGFDAIHSGLGLAVAKRMGIPWFALNFSVIPSGLACFCDQLSPDARVQLVGSLEPGDLRALALTSLEKFESRSIQAPAYIAPSPPSIAGKVRKLPDRLSALVRTLRQGRQREFLQFTDGPGRYSVAAAIVRIRLLAASRKAISTVDALESPPLGRYVLFGLHTQPESSIDVWAPFFSNQLWVIELLSRSLPPSHKLLVKIHKSDVANYSSKLLERMRSFPGVELVRPFADARSFIERADLVVAIQGTMGLEAALLGKPVIMLGDSPVTLFPSASRVGEIQGLPALIRRKIFESAPTREQIVRAYVSYLAPFSPASHNDWKQILSAPETEAYVRLFDRLRQHVSSGPAGLQTE